MSDYLRTLALRTIAPPDMIRPRPAARFEGRAPLAGPIAVTQPHEREHAVAWSSPQSPGAAAYHAAAPAHVEEEEVVSRRRPIRLRAEGEARRPARAQGEARRPARAGEEPGEHGTTRGGGEGQEPGPSQDASKVEGKAARVEPATANPVGSPPDVLADRTAPSARATSRALRLSHEDIASGQVEGRPHLPLQASRVDDEDVAAIRTDAAPPVRETTIDTPTAAASEPARRADATRASRRPSETRSDPTKVSVTIGRIEVHSSPTQAVSPPVEIERPVLALDDYLRRREGGR